MKRLILLITVVLLPIFAFSQNKTIISDLKKAGVSIFNNESYVKPMYEGCGSYFSINKSDNKKGNYIFIGMVTDYWGKAYRKDFNIEMVIDGEVVNFQATSVSKNALYTVLKNYEKNITVHINLKKMSEMHEYFEYKGSLTLIKKGRKYIFPLYGGSGC
ncbi:MAG: hypothetical protein Q4A00_06595 [Flavobacteriaceae bacterium]|nr:hypothetical protein [Flavobacteriaceae bacterium]